MDRTAYCRHLKNLHSWASHLETTIATAIPLTIAELGPAGQETREDLRNAAKALHQVADSLDDLMNAYDVLLESAGRPRRYDDFLQSLDQGDAEVVVPSLDDSTEETKQAQPSAPLESADSDIEINRARFAQLAGEIQFDAGWLMGSIQSALIGHEEDRIDEHLDQIATGIEELLISYDRLQDLIGVMPSRHCAFVEHMVVLEEAGRKVPSGH